MSGGGGSRIKIEFPDEAAAAAAAAGDKSPSSDHRHQHLDKSPYSDEHAEEKIVQADDDVHTDNERGEEEEADELNNESQVEDEEEEKSKVLGEGFYEIEAIRKKRVHKGQVQYLIKWKSYPESANTWEPYDNLELIADVVDAFEQRSNSSSSRSSKKRRRQLAMQKAWAAKRSPGKNEQREEEKCASVKPANERGRGRPRGSKGRGRPQTAVETLVPKRNPRRRKITSTDKSPAAAAAADEHEQPQVEMNMTTPAAAAAAIVSVTTSREGKQEKEREKEKEEANVMNIEGAKEANLSLMSVPVLLPHSQTPITGAKKRKSGCVKRFVQQQQQQQQGEDEGETTNSSLKQQQGRQEQQVDSNSTEAVVVSKGKGDPSPSITKILRTVQMDAAAANSNQAATITFQALRSDGSHVLIDNHHLKATNPLLLIDFYERIIQFNPKA